MPQSVLRRSRRLAALGALVTAVATASASRLPAAQTATSQATAATSDTARMAAGVFREYPSGSPAPEVSARAAATAATPAQSTQAQHNPHDLPWRVGFAKELLDPTAAQLATHNFHLGGYGIFPTRQAQGPLVDGDGTVEHIAARAIAVSDQANHTLLLGALENQGTFTADKQCACGIWDIRQQVSHDTGVPVDMIVVNSDHSHAGPDLIGLWGGVPVSHLQYVRDQAVLALDTAYRNRVPANLLVGGDTPVIPDPAVGGYVPGTATPGEAMVHSQFAADALTGYDDSAVDTELRVLQAVDAHGRMLGTLINYAAHATVMDDKNLLYSADWPGRAARATENVLSEPVAVTMVADVGRSQPPRPISNPRCGQPGQVTCNVDKLDTYTRLLTPWILQAVASAKPVTGNGVAGAEVMTREAGSNGALIGVSYTGEAPVRGYGAYRAATPPWFTGTAVGTFVSAHRIGDVLLTAAPGEAYPDVRFGVQNSINGAQSLFTFGLANDQLGYLIAPTSEYQWIVASNPTNDNAFFNVAPQYGDHVMCTQTALAESLGFPATGNPAPYGSKAPAPPCSALTASDLLPTGPTPQQPWAFGDGSALPSPAPQ